MARTLLRGIIDHAFQTERQDYCAWRGRSSDHRRWAFRVVLQVSALAGLLGCLGWLDRAGAQGQQPQRPQRWIVGYYPGWDVRDYPPEQVNFGALTHVVMFSVVPTGGGGLDLTFFINPAGGPTIARDISARAHAAGRKALLAVGGGGYVDALREAAAPRNRAAFVANLSTLMREWNYDGLDIDWEPLAEGDHADFVALAVALREATPNLLLTADLSWRRAFLPLTAVEAGFLRQIAPLFDKLNIMAYDMSGDWSGWLSWHNSALSGAERQHPSSVESSVEVFLSAGVPPAKLTLGIPFYGACWSGPVTGPRQPLSGARIVASDQDMPYRRIVRRHLSPEARRYDPAARAPYLSLADPTVEGCRYISYDDERSVADKARYAAAKGLGGVSIWSVGEGYIAEATPTEPLLQAVVDAFPPPPEDQGAERRR